MNAPADVVTAKDCPPLTARADRLAGWFYGAIAALIWAGYQVLTKHGLSGGADGGFTPLELTLFRFGIPGIVLLPVLLRQGLPEMRRLGFWRIGLLTLVAGPLLGMSTAQGYVLAPLAHGAVLFPAFVTLSGVLLSRLVLGTLQSRAQMIGLAFIAVGLAVVGGIRGGEPMVWLGDALFLFSGLLWGLFTVMLRYWAINGLTGTALASAGSTMVALLLFAVFGDLGHLAELPPGALWTQVIFQGLFAGVLAVVAYGTAVQRLGAATASLFPATVPLLALLLGVSAFDATVLPSQWLGLGITTFGLMLAVGLLKRGR